MIELLRAAIRDTARELGSDEFLAVQRQQFFIRMGVSTAFLAYLAWHAPFFATLWPLVLTSWALHLGFCLASLFFWLERRPISLARVLSSAAFDIYMIAMAATVDGGMESPIFALYLSPVISNGMRYGPPLLLFTALLAVFGIFATGIAEARWIHEPDWALLPVEVLLVVYIASYAYAILARLQRHHRRERAAQGLLQQVIEHGAQPTALLSASELRIEQANHAWRRLLGKDGAIGRAIGEIVLEDDRAALRTACLRALRQMRPMHAYIRLGTADGTELPCLALVAPLEIDKRKRLAVFLANIEESMRIERLEAEAQKAAYTAALAAGIAHDFRNLLTTIIGEAELIAMEHPDPSLRRPIAAILRAGEQGALLTEQLLRFGRDRGEKEVVDLAEHLPAMIELLRVRLPKGVRLVLELERRVPKVRASIAQLQQALLNLVDNAAYALAGKGTIVVRLRAGNDSAILEVEDDGPGIPPEQQARLFQPFATSHPEDGGTGLGLLMVQRIAHWHGGDVKLESTPGKGTKVRIVLPKADASKADERKVRSFAMHMPPEEASAPLAGRCVLVVDDEAPVLQVQAAMLRKAGAAVIEARSGEEALARVAKLPMRLDAAILDFMMPGMNGLELAEALRQRVRPDLPIAILTGYGDDEALRTASQRGIRIVDKPVSYPKLVDLVRTLTARG